MNYRGRFAPSPTGPLHLGSLLAALASYLDARANQGTWLVRIEDLDPPRIQTGAEQAILQALTAHGLEWDEPLVRQSERLDIYQQKLNELLSQGKAFHCGCSRAELKAREALHRYDGYCKQNLPSESKLCAVRAEGGISPSFLDLIQGQQASEQVADFVIFRRDGFFAYQLAVVVDDHLQGITRVVRGKDLLDEAPKQLVLQKKLGFSQLEYAHTPLILAKDGQKLSKQTFAKAIGVSKDQVRDQIITLLEKLNQNPPKDLIYNEIKDILSWATKHWKPAKLPKDLSL